MRLRGEERKVASSKSSSLRLSLIGLISRPCLLQNDLIPRLISNREHTHFHSRWTWKKMEAQIPMANKKSRRICPWRQATSSAKSSTYLHPLISMPIPWNPTMWQDRVYLQTSECQSHPMSSLESVCRLEKGTYPVYSFIAFLGSHNKCEEVFSRSCIALSKSHLLLRAKKKMFYWIASGYSFWSNHF